MALTKIPFVDDVTLIEAEFLNNIQDSIIGLEENVWEVNLTSVNNLDDVKRTMNAFCNNVVGRPNDSYQYGFISSRFNNDGTAGFQIYRVFSIVNGVNVGAIYQREFLNSQWYAWHQIGGGDNSSSIVVASTHSSASVNTNSVRKAGRVVDVNFTATGLTLSTNQWVDLGYLPTGFRPPVSSDFTAWDNTNGVPIQTRILANGHINLWLKQVTGSLRFHCTFITD